MENIELDINKLSDRDKFKELVDDYASDGSWLREHKLNPLNPDKEQVREILYNQMH